MIYYTYLILFGCSLHVNDNEAFAEFSWNVRYYTVIRPPSSTMFCWGHRILPNPPHTARLRPSEKKARGLAGHSSLSWHSMEVFRVRDRLHFAQSVSCLLNHPNLCKTPMNELNQILSSKLWHVFFVDYHGLPKGSKPPIYFATWHLPVVEAHPRIQPCRDWSEWLPQTNGRGSHSKSKWPREWRLNRLCLSLWQANWVESTTETERKDGPMEACWCWGSSPWQCQVQ